MNTYGKATLLPEVLPKQRNGTITKVAELKVKAGHKK